MSYFPKRTMPLTPKDNAPGSAPTDGSRISADDYNRHDVELQAIEQYLSGDVVVPSLSCGLPATVVKGPNLVQAISALTDQLNTFVEDGVSSSSGYVLLGERIVFPEQAFTSFLTVGALASDRTISVSDTTGFPSAGYISILNPVKITVGGQPAGQSTVEWISYNGKTQTSFLNCDRGVLGTTAMAHPMDNLLDLWIVNRHAQIPAGTVVDPDGVVTTFLEDCPPGNGRCSFGYYGKLVRVSSPTKNIMVENAPYEINPIVSQLNRPYPALRYYRNYHVASIFLTGTRRSLAYTIGLSPESVNLNSPGTSLVVAAAQAAGILVTIGGESFLSGSLGRNALTAAEATSFVDAMITNGAATLSTGPNDVPVTTQLVPVFQGRMSVNYSMMSVIDTGGLYLEVSQTGGGRLYVSKTNISTDFLFYASCAYHTMFVPSLETRAERNRT